MPERIPIEQRDPFLDARGAVIVVPAERGFAVHAAGDDPAAKAWAEPMRERRYRTAAIAAQAISARAARKPLPEETSRRPRRAAQTAAAQPPTAQTDATSAAPVSDREFGFSEDLLERDERQRAATRQRA